MKYRIRKTVNSDGVTRYHPEGVIHPELPYCWRSVCLNSAPCRSIEEARGAIDAFDRAHRAMIVVSEEIVEEFER